MTDAEYAWRGHNFEASVSQSVGHDGTCHEKTGHLIKKGSPDIGLL